MEKCSENTDGGMTLLKFAEAAETKWFTFKQAQ